MGPRSATPLRGCGRGRVHRARVARGRTLTAAGQGQSGAGAEAPASRVSLAHSAASATGLAQSLRAYYTGKY